VSTWGVEPSYSWNMKWYKRALRPILEQAVAAPAWSIKAVIAALTGNFLVTVIKFVAFFLSGSGAMLSEAIHSTAEVVSEVVSKNSKRGTRAGTRLGVDG
jgi:cation efflux family protein